MPLILGTNSIKDTGYDVANSCRFDNGSSDYLSRTPSSAGNRRTFTISTWFKLSDIDTWSAIISAGSSGNDHTEITFNGGTGNDPDIEFKHYNGSSFDIQLETDRVFRDISAWYHIVIEVDTTQATSSDRVKMYINGVQETSFATSTYPSQNFQTNFNNTNIHTIGRGTQSGTASTRVYFDGYMAETVLIDGTALDPTSFGAFNPVTNIWEPIGYGGTYGTNGFRLDFANSSALGNDVSGNDNDFTVNNLTSVDQSTDTCSNNFATWNSLTNGSYQTLSDGNLKGTGNTSTNNGNTWSTIHFPSAGKWYWETKVTAHSSSANYPQVGIIRDNTIAQGDMNTGDGGYVSGSKDCYYPAGSTTVYSKDGNDTVSATSVNDILMCAMDSTAGAMKFWIGVNGTWFASGDPANGNNAQWAETGDFQPVAFQSNFNNSVSETNFGAPTFSISSGNADANGHGNFEYAPPTGFFALCTKNLAEFGG